LINDALRYFKSRSEKPRSNGIDDKAETDDFIEIE
jgi:hypothetical protein